MNNTFTASISQEFLLFYKTTGSDITARLIFRIERAWFDIEKGLIYLQFKSKSDGFDD